MEQEFKDVDDDRGGWMTKTMIGVVKVMTWIAAVVLRRTINSEIEITDSGGIMVLLGSITTVTNKIRCEE